jgi:hypothetical protein
MFTRPIPRYKFLRHLTMSHFTETKMDEVIYRKIMEKEKQRREDRCLQIIEIWQVYFLYSSGRQRKWVFLFFVYETLLLTTIDYNL